MGPAGKVLIDATNPLKEDLVATTWERGYSAAEVLQQALPGAARCCQVLQHCQVRSDRARRSDRVRRGGVLPGEECLRQPPMTSCPSCRLLMRLCSLLPPSLLVQPPTWSRSARHGQAANHVLPAPVCLPACLVLSLLPPLLQPPPPLQPPPLLPVCYLI